MGMTKRTTLNTGQMYQKQSIGHIYAQPRGMGTTFHLGPHRGCTQEQNEQQVASEGRPCSIKRVGCLLAPVKNVISCLNNSTSWQGTEPTSQGIARTMPGLLVTRVVWLQKLLYGSRMGRGNLQLGHLTPSQYYQMSRQYIILRLNSWPYTTTLLMTF